LIQVNKVDSIRFDEISSQKIWKRSSWVLAWTVVAAGMLTASPGQAVIANQGWPQSASVLEAAEGLPGASLAQARKSVPARVKCGQEVPVTDPGCQKEFDDWQAKEKKWRENRQVYANYVSRGAKRPDPPSWIEPYCREELMNQDTVGVGRVCEAYDDYLRYDWAQHVDGVGSAVTYSKSVVQGTSGDRSAVVEYLLKNWHGDGLWTSGSNRSSAFGLLGAHLTLAHSGRLYLWGPPGMLVLRRPEGKFEVKMTWGIDLFLADVPVPFAQRKVPLYLSVARVFGKTEQEAIEHGANAGLGMFGFSMTIQR